MNLTPQEVDHIITCLERTSSYTIARSEQIDHPGIFHTELIEKFKNYRNRIHWKELPLLKRQTLNTLR